jgi:hypothetical protein
MVKRIYRWVGGKAIFIEPDDGVSHKYAQMYTNVRTWRKVPGAAGRESRGVEMIAFGEGVGWNGGSWGGV